MDTGTTRFTLINVDLLRIRNVTEAVETIEEPKDSKVQLTPAQWAEIVMLWELGEVKADELVARFGISLSGIKKGLQSRGVTRGSRAHEVAARVKETVLAARGEDSLTEEQERQKRIKDTRSQHYDWAKMLGQQVVGAYIKAQKDGRPFESEFGNIKTLRMGLAALEIARKERFAVLNADDDMGEGELPTLPMEDLSDHEIGEMQKTDDNEDLILAGLEDDVVELV